MFKKKLVGVKSIVGIKSERTIVATGEYTQEVRYYVTSLDNTKPEEIASAIMKRLKAGWDEKYLSQLLQENNF